MTKNKTVEKGLKFLKGVADKAAQSLPEKASIPGIVDPMLEAGTFTRQEIMAKVRELRPDFKDPSAAVSNGFRRLVAAGKYPALKDAGAPRVKRQPGAPRQASPAVLAERLAKVDAWAARMDVEISDGFAKRDRFLASRAAEPKHRRVWP
jgi:hypothetical protein